VLESLVRGSTNSKAASDWDQRLCLHPPRPRRTPVTSHGIRQGVELAMESLGISPTRESIAPVPIVPVELAEPLHPDPVRIS
jgi:hypothetical protein